MEATLRPAVEADLPALTAVYNHYVTHTAITFDLEPFTPGARRSWFEGFGTDPRHRLLVAERAGRVLGYACSGRLRPKAAYDASVETTIYLAPEACGRGLGRRLYGRLLEELAAAGVHRCYGVVTLPNDASLALHHALGYREVGRLHECGRKFDRWWDVAWLEKGLP